jgi:hypothetical protein
VLIEDQLAKFEEKMDKEVAKAKKRFGDSFDEAMFRQTNPRVLANKAKWDELHSRFEKAMNDNNLDELITVLEENESDAIAIANIGLSYDAQNPQTAEFVSWVLTEGVKYNHQFGLLNTKVDLQASK